WSLSEEFTIEIGTRLKQEKKIHLQDIEKTYASLKKAKLRSNPFGNEIDWIGQVFTEEDFVVFLEIVEHDEVLKQDKQNPADPHLCSSDLNITLRVRVFDLTQDKPRVVLQELLHETQFIPAPFTYVNFYQSSWQEDAFSISPTGLAHAKLYKEASLRIKDYILL
ncbi:MAG: hypothetical protein HYZ48_01930, partial [Chlamydiales bacterium]|nr:hypothetical protein [Chlamydiales bacterium]